MRRDGKDRRKEQTTLHLNVKFAFKLKNKLILKKYA